MVFRAVIIGNPTPEVTWTRNNGEIDEERYKITYDKSSGEHQLQVGSWLLTIITDKVNTCEVLVKVCGPGSVRYPMCPRRKLTRTNVLPRTNTEKLL